MLGTGTSKIRGNKDGGIQAQSYWNSIILTTGEEPLIKTNSQGGITSRVLEVEGKPFDNEEEASKMYSLSEQNYGVAGPEFITKLIEEYGDNFSKLKDEYNVIQEQLLKDVKGKSRAYAGYIALDIITDKLVNKYLYGDEVSEDSYQIGLEIYQKLPDEKDADLIEKFYEFADSWVASNHYNFDAYSYDYNKLYTQNNSKERYGIFIDNVEASKYTGKFKNEDTPDRVYQIFPSIFQNILLKEFNRDGHELNYRDVIKKLAEKGYILQEGNRNQIRVRYNKSSVRVIAFIPGQKIKSEEQEEQQEKAIQELTDLYSYLEVIE